MEEIPAITGEIRNEKGQFVKGVSGNPNGRPPGSLSITSLVRNELEKVPDGQKKSYAEILIAKILQKAIIEGDHATQKMIWNYIDGLPEASLDINAEVTKKIISLDDDEPDE